MEDDAINGLRNDTFAEQLTLNKNAQTSLGDPATTAAEKGSELSGVADNDT